MRGGDDKRTKAVAHEDSAVIGDEPSVRIEPLTSWAKAEWVRYVRPQSGLLRGATAACTMFLVADRLRPRRLGAILGKPYPYIEGVVR